jgi:hypothetical protein
MTERAATLLATLSMRGIVVTNAGRALRLRPRTALTPELLVQIRELKAELLALVTSGAFELLAAAGAWPTADEWRVLETLACVRRLTEPQLLGVTKLSPDLLARALSGLRLRAEIKATADGWLFLRVH